MTNGDIGLLAALLGAILAAAFFATAEASLLRVNKVRAQALVETDVAGAGRLRSLLERLPSVLNMILLLALVTQIGAASITGILAQRWFGDLAVSIASVVLTFVLFVYSEAIPKTYAIRHAESVALRVSAPVALLERVLRPVVALLVWLADIQLPGKGIETAPTITESELRLLAHTAESEGEISRHDRALIERAFRFGDRRADDIMVPRPDIVALEADEGLEEAIDVALKSGHRRLPIYDDSLDTILGVVRLRDMIRAREDGHATLRDLAISPLLVPESKSVSSVLDDMQSQRTHIALLVDEYGSTSGLVTIEDIVEELLGSISEDPSMREFQRIDDSTWRVAGSLPVEDLGQTGMEVPEGDWNTVAGLMMASAGRILGTGDVVEVDGFALTVEQTLRRRVTWVVVYGKEKDEASVED